MEEKNLRSFVKAASWRTTGTIDTFILSFLITGKLSYASAISITEIVTKIGLYYVHERVWNSIKWGKTVTVSPSKKEKSTDVDCYLETKITKLKPVVDIK